jgi:hydrogenase maturation protease
MTTSPLRTVVIGVGNEFRGDDGAGTVVARLLRKQLPAEILIIEESGEGTSLMDAWRGATSVILVDAVQSGAAPGTIHRFDVSAGPVPKGLLPCSTHAFGVAEAIELARALHELPPQVIVYGVEGGDFSNVDGLAGAVQRAAVEVVKRIVEELQTAS